MLMRTVVLGALLAVFGASGPVAAQEPPAFADPTGVYRCTGSNPDGTVYNAIVEIRKVDGTYRVLWQLPDDTVVIGVGIVSGDVLAVSYFGGSPAVVVYRRTGEQLTGEWTVGGAEGSVYSEILTVMPGHPPIEAPTPAPRPIPVPGRRTPASSSPVLTL
jgi:hypothetical protein